MRELDQTFPYDMNHILPPFISILLELWLLEDILECEFYVLEELDYSLLVFHPYRSLQPYLADLDEKDCLDSAWSIVNDSYRTDVSTFSFISLFKADFTKLFCLCIHSSSSRVRTFHIRSFWSQVSRKFYWTLQDAGLALINAWKRKKWFKRWIRYNMHVLAPWGEWMLQNSRFSLQPRSSTNSYSIAEVAFNPTLHVLLVSFSNFG